LSPPDSSDLVSFLSFLDEGLGFSFDKSAFSDRLKLQKYVFLAKFFGWDLGYKHSRYLRGPYSKELADHYYKLEGTGFSKKPQGFDEGALLGLVYSKDERWLELASTLLSFHEDLKAYSADLRSDVIRMTSSVKKTSPSELEAILTQLEEAGISF